GFFSNGRMAPPRPFSRQTNREATLDTAARMRAARRLTAAMASILPSLNREDRALVACYRCIYAPRTGGAYESHHRTAGIAGRARRCGGRLAARGARAAASHFPAISTECA